MNGQQQQSSAHATAMTRITGNGILRRYSRFGWLALVVLQVASFVPLLPLYLPLADHPCQESCLLTIQEARSLASAGIAPTLYVAGLLIVTVVNLLISTTIAVILFVRRSTDRMAVITAYMVLVLPTTQVLNLAPVKTSAIQTTAFSLPPVLDLAIGLLQASVIYGMFLLFPNGRFVPRWSWLLLPSFLVFTTVFTLWAGGQGALILGWPFFLWSAAACIAYRYWRIATPTERQQMKWVLFGLLSFLFLSQAYWMPTFTPLGATVYNPLSYLVYQIFLPVVPITVFIAVQRYRLWDIDRLINRTLVYGVLSLILVAVFVALIIGLQTLLGGVGIIGRDNRAAIVISTLVIAALFQPLRRRVQDLIDRHFYRHKYNAEQTLALFGAALRSDVDLDRLSNHLISVVADNMQPEHISLWLRRAENPLPAERLP